MDVLNEKYLKLMKSDMINSRDLFDLQLFNERIRSCYEYNYRTENRKSLLMVKRWYLNQSAEQTNKVPIKSAKDFNCDSLKYAKDEKVVNVSFIELFLIQNDISYEKERTCFNIDENLARELNISKRRFDYYLPEYNCLIEFDGWHHYSDIYGRDKLKSIIAGDQLKDQFCKKVGVNLLRLPSYLTYEEMCHKTIDFIIQQINLGYNNHDLVDSNNKKYFINYRSCKEFIDKMLYYFMVENSVHECLNVSLMYREFNQQNLNQYNMTYTDFERCVIDYLYLYDLMKMALKPRFLVSNQLSLNALDAMNLLSNSNQIQYDDRIIDLMSNGKMKEQIYDKIRL